ncbi:MAG: hypothetical protein AAGI28_11495 [Pseudomonadota bacterium]
MTMHHERRYDGKPLLRLLELYVLHVIGKISADDAERMVAMTPKLREIYGSSGEWPEIIAASVELPLEASSDIKDMWERNQEIARANAAELPPQMFAEMFVDENLAP